MKNITFGNEENIFDRLLAGKAVHLNDPEYHKISQIVNSTMGLAQKMNSSGNIDLVRNILSEIIDKPIDKSTIIFPPFYTNFGRFIHIGKNAFINHACSFLDMGGIYIDDEVLIGPKVNLITENHPLDPEDRKALIAKPITLKRRAWIGAGSTILPGVTVGQNAVVAAGSVVSKDVPDNVVVGGVPAKFIKSIY